MRSGDYFLHFVGDFISIISSEEHPCPVTYMKQDDPISVGSYLPMVLIADKEDNITEGHIMREVEKPLVDENTEEAIVNRVLKLVEEFQEVKWKQEHRVYALMVNIQSQQMMQESKWANI